MPDISTTSRFPNLGKLSIALLEHTVKSIIGEKAIDEIKSPVIEKDLINSLETALEKAEKRFISEYGDKEICEIVLNLPLSDLPSVIQAVRTFYSSPNASALGQVLSEQLKASFYNLSSERIDSGVSAYVRFLKDELANLSGDIRDKLGVHATLGIQDNTSRMANILEKILDQATPKETIAHKQLTKIVACSKYFDLPIFSSEQQAIEALKETTRQVFYLLGYAFLETCEISTAHDFNFLLSLEILTEKDQSQTLQIELVSHITPFVNVFDELITMFFNRSDNQEFLARTKSIRAI